LGSVCWQCLGISLDRDVTHDCFGYVEGERFVLRTVNVSGIIDASLLGSIGVWIIFVNQAGQMLPREMARTETSLHDDDPLISGAVYVEVTKANHTTYKHA